MKNKRKDVQKKKLIVTQRESKINIIVEEPFSLEKVAGQASP